MRDRTQNRRDSKAEKQTGDQSRDKEPRQPKAEAQAIHGIQEYSFLFTIGDRKTDRILKNLVQSLLCEIFLTAQKDETE